jgi:hypothetical protein
MGPADQGFGEARAAAEARQARVDAAVRAGWVIRFDPDRLEYRASRELLTARTLDLLLGAIEAGGSAG